MGKTGVIYIIKNKINNKVYIGQTIQNPTDRFKQHLKNARLKTTNQLIHKAINKYGAINFWMEILEADVPLHSLNRKEEQYIIEYSAHPNGYNLCPGGQNWRKKPINLDNKAIIELYKSGKSTRYIASMFSVSKDTVEKRLKEFGVYLRPKNCKLPDKTAHIQNRRKILEELILEQGLSYRDVAKRLNVSDKSIRNWVKKYNLVRI